MQKSVFFGSFGRNLLNATYFTITSKVCVIEQNRVIIFLLRRYIISWKFETIFFQFWPKIAKSLLSYTLDIYVVVVISMHFARGESDCHWVIHMIGPTRVYFKGFSLATTLQCYPTDTDFQEKSLRSVHLWFLWGRICDMHRTQSCKKSYLSTFTL